MELDFGVVIIQVNFILRGLPSVVKFADWRMIGRVVDLEAKGQGAADSNAMVAIHMAPPAGGVEALRYNDPGQAEIREACIPGSLVGVGESALLGPGLVKNLRKYHVKGMSSFSGHLATT